MQLRLITERPLQELTYLTYCNISHTLDDHPSCHISPSYTQTVAAFSCRRLSSAISDVVLFKVETQQISVALEAFCQGLAARRWGNP